MPKSRPCQRTRGQRPIHPDDSSGTPCNRTRNRERRSSNCQRCRAMRPRPSWWSSTTSVRPCSRVVVHLCSATIFFAIPSRSLQVPSCFVDPNRENPPVDSRRPSTRGIETWYSRDPCFRSFWKETEVFGSDRVRLMIDVSGIISFRKEFLEGAVVPRGQFRWLAWPNYRQIKLLRMIDERREFYANSTRQKDRWAAMEKRRDTCRSSCVRFHTVFAIGTNFRSFVGSEVIGFASFFSDNE